MEDPHKIEPLQVFLSAFGLSSFAGLAELLRSGRPVTWRNLLSATTNSGLIGLALGLVWYHYFLGQGNVYFLIGVCILAGLGGATMVDFILTIFKRGGINVNFKPPKEEDE